MTGPALRSSGSRRRARGTTLVDLLVGSMLALLVLAGTLAGMASGGHALAALARPAAAHQALVPLTHALPLHAPRAPVRPAPLRRAARRLRPGSDRRRAPRHGIAGEPDARGRRRRRRTRRRALRRARALDVPSPRARPAARDRPAIDAAGRRPRGLRLRLPR